MYNLLLNLYIGSIVYIASRLAPARSILLKAGLISRMVQLAREPFPKTTVRPCRIIDHYDCGVVAGIFRRPSSDEIVFRQVFTANELYPFIKCLHLNPIDVRTIVDAGANCGFTAIYLARMFPKAKIVALEPDEINYQQALLNLRLNGITSVKVIRAALWSEDRSLSLSRSSCDNADFAVKVFADSVEASEAAVSGVSLGTIMKDEGWDCIDLLKLDIEGAEQSLFDHYQLDWLEMVGALSVEPHEGYSTSEAMSDILKSKGWFTESYGELLFARKNSKQL